MANDRRSWIRDVLFIPLVVGIVVALVTAAVTFALPLSSDKELSFAVNGPKNYQDDEALVAW